MRRVMTITFFVVSMPGCVEKFEPAGQSLDENSGDEGGQEGDEGNAEPDPDEGGQEGDEGNAEPDPDPDPDEGGQEGDEGEGEGEGEDDRVINCGDDSHCVDITNICSCDDDNSIYCERKTGTCTAGRCDLEPVLVSACPFGCDHELNQCRPAPCPEGDTCCEGDEEEPPCNGCPEGTIVPEGTVCVPGGEFRMGSPEDENGRDGANERQIAVALTNALLVARTEITQFEWELVMDHRPSSREDCDNCPVEQIAWADVVAYANSLSTQDELNPCYLNEDGEVYGSQDAENRRAVVWQNGYDCEGWRLPTEAEWEYATRAGTTTPWWCGEDPECLEQTEWYLRNAQNGSHEVCLKEENAWGLCDTVGNVIEWVWNWYGPHPDLEETLINPRGPEGDGNNPKVFKGCGYVLPAESCRSASRLSGRPFEEIAPHVGARLVRKASQIGNL